MFILGNLAYTSKTDKYDSFLKLSCVVSNSETGDISKPIGYSNYSKSLLIDNPIK